MPIFITAIINLIVFLFSFLIPPTFAQESNLPDLGNSARGHLNVHTERFLGEGIMHSLNGTDQLVTDQTVNEYLQSLGNKLQSNAPSLDFPLHFFGVNTHEINAFAFFGGHIAVHTGLIQMVETESQLAAVLSHETAHIAQRHLARLVSTHKKMLPLTYAEILGALALSALGAPDLGMHLANIAMGHHQQQLINYTRDHEKEADRIGMQILTNSGFDPYAMPSVFQKLQATAKYDGRPPEYLLTHPVFESRIADTEGRAAQMQRQSLQEDDQFYLIRARIIVANAKKPKELVQKISQELNAQKYRHKTAAEYAYALALHRAGQTDKAKEALQNLIAQYPGKWIFSLSLAEIAREAGHLEEAAAHFQALLDNKDNTSKCSPRVVIFDYAETLLTLNCPKQAKELLNSYKSRFTTEPLFHQLMAKTHSKLNQKTELHQSQAEWHFNRGEYKEAIAQLNYGMEYMEHAKGKGYMYAKLQSRKQEIQNYMDKQKSTSL